MLTLASNTVIQNICARRETSRVENLNFRGCVRGAGILPTEGQSVRTPASVSSRRAVIVTVVLREGGGESR